MNRRRWRALFTLTLTFCAIVEPTRGHAESRLYERMAPLGRYLIAERTAEVATARSAAPPAISLKATVLVLTTDGYETAAQGTNGFTCLVERGWMKSFDDTEFWDWKIRAPVCYNLAASRSVLPYTLFRTQLVLRGVSKSDTLRRLETAITEGGLPAIAPGSMAYMMSKEQYLTDAGPPSWYPHVMFYAPKAAGANAGASWGADRRGSPVVYDSAHRVSPEPWAVFFVPVAHWSDGSLAPVA